jgi:hypothetical protein
MEPKLPHLIYEDLAPTRDYLQAVAHTLGSLQRAFLAKDPHDWQYGLEVNLRGLITQPFMIKDEQVRASLDFVRHKVRLGGSSWSLSEYSPPEIFNNVRLWLENREIQVSLEQPKSKTHTTHFDPQQASYYAAALWWLDTQFRELRASLSDGLVSPILLYPHHFDLSLVWFPQNDEQQLAIGFSSGDETIIEPYIYLTAYPEPTGFTKLTLPRGAYWQPSGFSGAILPYSALSASADPIGLFRDFAGVFAAARPLTG